MEAFLRNEYILTELRVIRRYETKCLAAFKRTDNALVRTFHDADDLTLTRTSRYLRWRDARHDSITVHGAGHHSSRHKHITVRFFFAHIRYDEAKALG